MEQVLSLSVDEIRPNPDQPRRHFDEVALDRLAASLHDHGVLQPILVRRLDDGGYELIAGERRWQAARRAGIAALPCVVASASPQRALELALVENVQRADLSPVEQAEAYRNLMSRLSLTQEQMARRLGISRAVVANRLRLLDLAPAALRALESSRITEGHARALLPLGPEQQARAVALVDTARLSVRQTERLVRRWTQGAGHDCRAEPDHEAGLLEAMLRDALGARVRVRCAGAGYSVLLHFHSSEAAHRLVAALAPYHDDEDL